MPTAAVIATMATSNPFAGKRWVFTVDFYRGVRLYPQNETGAVTAEYTALTLIDAFPTGLLPGRPVGMSENLIYGVDSTAARGVFVQGSGVSASAYDGSGKMGPVSYVTDNSITTTAQAQTAATALLAQYASPVRGQVSRIAWSDPGSGVYSYRPGSSVLITDARAGMTGTGRIIMQIAKTFLGGGLETWVISFGGRRPSMSQLVRRVSQNPRN